MKQKIQPTAVQENARKSIKINYTEMSSKDADGIENGVDPDQTVPRVHCLLRPVVTVLCDHLL